MTNLGEVLNQYRWATRQKLEDVAAAIGLSPSTLGSIERGGKPNGDSLTKILLWVLSPTTAGETTMDENPETETE